MYIDRAIFAKNIQKDIVEFQNYYKKIEINYICIKIREPRSFSTLNRLQQFVDFKDDWRIRV